MNLLRTRIQSALSRFTVALLLSVGVQATSATLAPPALASATTISDFGTNSSEWSGDVILDPTGGNLGSAFTFGKNTLINNTFGSSGSDFSGATIEFQVKFVDPLDYIAVFWGQGQSGGTGATNSLYVGPAGNAGSSSSLAGRIGISGGHTGPHIYWHGVDGGVSGTGSSSVTSGNWATNRWYAVKIAIGATQTSYFVDGVLAQTKATELPASNTITIGGDDRNGWGFSNGVFVDNISIASADSPVDLSRGSLYLNNTSISHAFNTNLDVGTGQYTIEMWVKPVGNKGQPLWGSNITGSWNISADTGLGSSCAGPNRLLIAVQAQACPYTTPVGSFSTDEVWRHVVWQRGAAGAMSVYINGIRQLSVTDSANVGLKAGPLKIGWSERAAFTGYITNVRLVKGSALYSGASITPPVDALSTSVPTGTTTFLLRTSSAATALKDSVSDLTMTADGTANFGWTVAMTPMGGMTWSTETPFAAPLDVTYLLDGGIGDAPAQPPVRSGQSFTTADTPTRPGYTFLGWSDGETTAAANTSYTMPATALTLTAQWSADPQTITYNLNGGSGDTPTQSNVPTDEDFTTAVTPTRPGYTFLGWSDGETTTAANTSYTVRANAVTLTAQWSADPHTITYDLNGGSGDTPTQSNVVTDDDFTTAPVPIREFWAFSGWYDGSSTTEAGERYQVGLTDVTLTAQWTRNYSTVTFDSQNWLSPVVSSTAQGSGAAVPPTPAWYGYNFIGWAESENGSPVDVPVLPITGDKTFFAVWEQKSLAGLTSLPTPDVIIPHALYERTLTTSWGYHTATIKVPAGALPSTFQVKVYTLDDDNYAANALGEGTYLISQVVAWSDTAPGSVGNIQDTAPNKPIEMTFTSPLITAGAKVYAVLGGSSTLLATATVNGSVTVEFSEDPVIIVEAGPPIATTPVPVTPGNGFGTDTTTSVDTGTDVEPRVVSDSVEPAAEASAELPLATISEPHEIDVLVLSGILFTAALVLAMIVVLLKRRRSLNY